MGSGASKSKSPTIGDRASFLDYQQIKPLLKRGDIVEILRDPYSHYVIFEKTNGNHYMCFHITTEDTQLHADIGVLNYQPLLEILKDTVSGEPSLCRINNQEITGQRLVTKKDKPMPDLNQVFQQSHDNKGVIRV